MAARTTNYVIVALGALFVTIAAASDVFKQALSDVKPCVEVCDSTYPSHTYEKGSHHECCKRGCRFFSIMEFVNCDGNVNTTQKECIGCCKESYKSEAEFGACVLGCKSQTPFAMKKGLEAEHDGPKIHLMYPLMYMHSLYSNMIQKAYHRMSVSWSMYVTADNGKLVIIRSQPQFYTEFNDAQDPDDYKGMANPDDKTANYLEMNIEPIDNGATPILKHSQLRSARGMEDSLYVRTDGSVSSDWLTCIARKTGIPRLILCLLMLFCSIVMIWLCLTAAVTAPEHRIHTPKLSINGDLDYLREMVKHGHGIKVLRPQDTMEASPLPIKIRVERI